MERLGTAYGGWSIPKNIDLNENSIIYSGGVGEDISFDMLLSDKYNCNIFLIDPTKRAKIHFDEVKNYYNTKDWKFTGDIQKDYFNNIHHLIQNFKKMKYLDIGLWEKKDTLKFYKQIQHVYHNHSFQICLEIIIMKFT